LAGAKKKKAEPRFPVGIDDPNDLLNQQIVAMTRPIPEFRVNNTIWVLYVGMLTPAWDAQLSRHSVIDDGLRVIDNAARGGMTPADLRRVANRLSPIDARTTDDEVRMMLARAIVARQICVIRKNGRVAVGRANPTVFAAVNAQYATRIDFNFLATWEGGQYLHGYVPITGGRVAGASGITIATGFDIGQISGPQLQRMSLEPTLQARLSPFVDLPFKAKGVSFKRAEVIAILLRINKPVPTITQAEANTIDTIVHGDHVAAAQTAWNGAKATGVPSFTQLPEPWQTVIFSRFYHQGKSAHRTTVMATFWTAATTGEWEAAATALQNYAVSPAWYKTRVRQEAAHLRLQMPPEIPKPKKPVPKAK
jgi:Bacterial toxin homologue of phage lysozyme, C-term